MHSDGISVIWGHFGTLWTILGFLHYEGTCAFSEHLHLCIMRTFLNSGETSTFWGNIRLLFNSEDIFFFFLLWGHFWIVRTYLHSEDISAVWGHFGDNSALQRHFYIIRVFITCAVTSALWGLCVQCTLQELHQVNAGPYKEGIQTCVCAFLSMLTSK